MVRNTKYYVTVWDYCWEKFIELSHFINPGIKHTLLQLKKKEVEIEKMMGRKTYCHHIFVFSAEKAIIS